MEQERKQFTFYRSYYDAIRKLSRRDASAVAFAIMAYGLDGEEPEGLTLNQSAFFELVRPTLDNGRKKAAAGSLGGKAQAKPKQNAREKEKEKEIEKESEKEGEMDNKKQRPPEKDAFEKFFASYPSSIGHDAAWESWCRLRPDDAQIRQIFSALEGWKASKRWQEESGRFVPRAAKWLSEGHWQSPPAPEVSKELPKGASGELGQAELEAIQRILGGDGHA